MALEVRHSRGPLELLAKHRHVVELLDVGVKDRKVYMRGERKKEKKKDRKEGRKEGKKFFNVECGGHIFVLQCSKVQNGSLP
jgi:hypothetical protein